MIEKISKICEKFELEHDIKILFAIENGSRAWRFQSEDSDYDIRFVYVRPLPEYIQIVKPKDVINAAYNADLEEVPVEQSLLDFSGFDIFKYVGLLSKSNPTAIEWLISDIVYHGDQNKVFKEFALEQFNPASLYHHYKALCKHNYMKYISSGRKVSHKRYLYVMRGLLNARWVTEKNAVPPINFLEVLNTLSLPDQIHKKLEEFIEIKKQGKEKGKIIRVPSIDAYIEGFLEQETVLPNTTSNDVNVLVEELKKIVLAGYTRKE